MWIEMRATGRVSTAQKAVPENLRAMGSLVVGEHPASEAITAISTCRDPSERFKF